MLGHALSRQAIHGGTAKHATSAAQKIAAGLRGGRRPPASVSPAALRATRALLRRRTHRLRTRAELFSPGQHPTRQYHRPELGKQLAAKAKRAGGADRFAAAAVHKTRAVDLALIPYDEARLKARARARLPTALHDEANPLSLLHTVPGLGTMLSHVRRYDMPQLERFPSVPEGAS